MPKLTHFKATSSTYTRIPRHVEPGHLWEQHEPSLWYMEEHYQYGYNIVVELVSYIAVGNGGFAYRVRGPASIAWGVNLLHTLHQVTEAIPRPYMERWREGERGGERWEGKKEENY